MEKILKEQGFFFASAPLFSGLKTNFQLRLAKIPFRQKPLLAKEGWLFIFSKEETSPLHSPKKARNYQTALL